MWICSGRGAERGGMKVIITVEVPSIKVAFKSVFNIDDTDINRLFRTFDAEVSGLFKARVKIPLFERFVIWWQRKKWH